MGAGSIDSLIYSPLLVHEQLLVSLLPAQGKNRASGLWYPSPQGGGGGNELIFGTWICVALLAHETGR